MVKFSWMLVMCFALMCPTASFASDRTHEGDRLPEPMLVESTTDIDSDESEPSAKEQSRGTTHRKWMRCSTTCLDSELPAHVEEATSKRGLDAHRRCLGSVGRVKWGGPFELERHPDPRERLQVQIERVVVVQRPRE